MSARILIIEDNATNLELMRYLLLAFGHSVVAASDGRQGLTAARYAIPDLIICDIHLPKLDGFGVVRKLKDDPVTRIVPVIAVTAQAMVGDRDRLLGAGFDGYICKPIEPECFVAQLEAFLPAALQASRLHKVPAQADDHNAQRQADSGMISPAVAPATPVSTFIERPLPWLPSS